MTVPAAAFVAAIEAGDFESASWALEPVLGSKLDMRARLFAERWADGDESGALRAASLASVAAILESL